MSTRGRPLTLKVGDITIGSDRRISFHFPRSRRLRVILSQLGPRVRAPVASRLFLHFSLCGFGGWYCAFAFGLFAYRWLHLIYLVPISLTSCAKDLQEYKTKLTLHAMR